MKKRGALMSFRWKQTFDAMVLDRAGVLRIDWNIIVEGRLCAWRLGFPAGQAGELVAVVALAAAD